VLPAMWVVSNTGYYIRMRQRDFNNATSPNYGRAGTGEIFNSSGVCHLRHGRVSPFVSFLIFVSTSPSWCSHPHRPLQIVIGRTCFVQFSIFQCLHSQKFSPRQRFNAIMVRGLQSEREPQNVTENHRVRMLRNKNFDLFESPRELLLSVYYVITSKRLC